jgi:Nucleotidyltransferase of unknown function (DUF6036)
MIARDSLAAVLNALGATLAERGLTYEVLVVGGSGLLLLGYITRTTRDVDVVAFRQDGEFREASSLPGPLRDAAAATARAFGLSDDWLNTGPANLMFFGLPEGYQDRLQVSTYGGLTIHAAGRADQIALKLYAATDATRLRDLDDLRAINPSEAELVEAARWVMAHRLRRFRYDVAYLLRGLGVEDADGKL